MKGTQSDNSKYSEKMVRKHNKCTHNSSHRWKMVRKFSKQSYNLS